MGKKQGIIIGIAIVLILALAIILGIVLSDKKTKDDDNAVTTDTTGITTVWETEGTEFISTENTTGTEPADKTEEETTKSYETTTESVTENAGQNQTTAPSESVPVSKEASYTAAFKVTNSWEENGMKCYQYSGTVTNNAAGTINTWKITWDVGSGATVINFWNSSCKISGSTLTIQPADYNAVLTSGQSISDIGFIIKTSKNITDFTYNGKTTQSTQDSGNDKPQEVPKETQGEKETEYVPPKPDGKSPVDTHGKLSVKGTDLVDKNGKKFQLKGVSTHGLQWFPQYVNEAAFKTLRDNWGANVVRLAMYTAEGGYCNGGNKKDIENTLHKGVDAATALGMYVIIDWHILSDGNPNTYADEAAAFFDKVSKKYAKNVNVIYEICNEPNGGTSWSEIKKYADRIIPVIRANDKDAIILVGTPTWSQEVDKVAANPVNNPKNVMYTLHFYAATHKDDIRNRLTTARNAGTPVFVSEFSICDASGNGGIDYDSAEKWKNLINKYNISYCGWSLCNKAETSALISSGCSKTSGWSTNELSEAGKWLRNFIKG